MNLQSLHITSQTPDIRLLGRMDPEQDPVALDWTGSGIECRFRGSDFWAELEAPALSPIMWMIVLADGSPVTRFPVEPGIRFYPLLLGLEAEQVRTVTLMKETQCMPDNPEATVRLHSLRFAGTLEKLPEKAKKIEFIGDSLTSGEGALAARGNQEWVTPWFTARGNYAWYACDALDAEMRLLSQSGWGVCWDWQHQPEHNMTDVYDLTVGALKGTAAEKRGCGKPWDFSLWQPDIVCVRLLTNDLGGVNAAGAPQGDLETVEQGCETLIRKIRGHNPKAKIVWILPGTAFHPEIAEEAVRRLEDGGMENLCTFALPDYGPEDMGARDHPNAEWNRTAGRLLAEYLKSI